MFDSWQTRLLQLSRNFDMTCLENPDPIFEMSGAMFLRTGPVSGLAPRRPSVTL